MFRNFSPVYLYVRHLEPINMFSLPAKLPRTSRSATTKIHRSVYRNSWTSTFVAHYRKSYVRVRHFSCIVYHC